MAAPKQQSKEDIGPGDPITMAYLHQPVFMPGLGSVPRLGEQPGMKLFWMPNYIRVEFKGRVFRVPQAAINLAVE